MRMSVAIVVLSWVLTTSAALAQEAAEKPAETPQRTRQQPAGSTAGTNANAGATAGANAKVDQAELDKQFEKTMTGATLIGRFTVEGRGNREGAREPREERYHISKVTKTQGDYWVFVARVQYGKKDVTVPMMLQVKWAGDTPVITLTDLNIPGLGTYTARVLIFRDHYAGYWSGGDHGGNLWGRIERNGEGGSDKPAAPDAPEAPDAPQAPDAPKAPQPPAESK